MYDFNNIKIEADGVYNYYDYAYKNIYMYFYR